MKFKIIIAFFILILTNSCSNKYASTNRSYKKQTKAFAKELRKQPSAIDSAMMAQQWVGATNFGMRKPNFVIIHHTAQNACDSTLRTFTLPLHR
jgi:N-acetylmuramoyl-L-alanine amidase